MEELYVETFSRQAKTLEPVVSPVLSLEKELSPIKSQDCLIEMALLLDRLEKEIEKECSDFKDYQFIFSGLREQINQKKIEEIFPLLDDLEELLDLGLPNLILKKDLAP